MTTEIRKFHLWKIYIVIFERSPSFQIHFYNFSQHFRIILWMLPEIWPIDSNILFSDNVAGYNILNHLKRTWKLAAFQRFVRNRVIDLMDTSGSRTAFTIAVNLCLLSKKNESWPQMEWSIIKCFSITRILSTGED